MANSVNPHSLNIIGPRVKYTMHNLGPVLWKNERNVDSQKQQQQQLKKKQKRMLSFAPK